MIIKNTIREILILLHLDLTKNLKYDRLTRLILKENINKNTKCIDIGCHKGEILTLMLKHAPNIEHYGFEPIPYLYKELKSKFKNKANILPYALSDINGNTTFQLVKNAPAYSGIKRRKYDIENPEIEEINVEVKTLDTLIPVTEKIHFIKIDVEGGEFNVLKGAKNMLKSNKPFILFEFGKGASDYYDTNPVDLFNFITIEIGLNIFTLQAFIENKLHLNSSEFERIYDSNEEYYFIAGPAK
ncbi:MAG: FkbM family methyltransferase [Candidatus Methylacidiphilales bacterium]